MFRSNSCRRQIYLDFVCLSIIGPLIARLIGRFSDCLFVISTESIVCLLNCLFVYLFVSLFVCLLGEKSSDKSIFFFERESCYQLHISLNGEPPPF